MDSIIVIATEFNKTISDSHIVDESVTENCIIYFK